MRHGNQVFAANLRSLLCYTANLRSLLCRTANLRSSQVFCGKLEKFALACSALLRHRAVTGIHVREASPYTGLALPCGLLASRCAPTERGDLDVKNTFCVFSHAQSHRACSAPERRPPGFRCVLAASCERLRVLDVLDGVCTACRHPTLPNA